MDVVRLNNYITEKGTTLASALAKNGHDADAFSGLTRITLAKLILFNQKRQGEASKAKLTDWAAKRKAQASREIISTFDKFERCMVNILEHIKIKGKRGRIVPVLITIELRTWMEVLLETRSYHIPASNTYLFPSLSEHTNIRVSDVLRNFASECGASKPTLLTSTCLKKYCAYKSTRWTC